MTRVSGAALRQKILDEAVELVRTRGVNQVTMRGLAERLGYSPATIYLHFKNKNELLREVSRKGFDELVELAEARLHGDDPSELLREGALLYIRWARRNPDLYALMFQDDALGELAHEDIGHRFRLWSLYRDLLDRGIRSGQFQPGSADLMTMVAWSMMHGWITLMSSGRPLDPVPGVDNLERLGEAMIDQAMALIRV